eukprot:CAMPEP_0194403952 /NCGR_PEP_ID=MMETSP0176-20130528/2512_1 /TAXON_ID=216777 /ORGANISM="Proboscia alata, Strain PI-D3" /LENGTH=768 /DNA_ID=CAMNT_0039202021 /DNA_START=79 /DNA_END=2385 /DNA_ORIENTATION=-
MTPSAKSLFLLLGVAGYNADAKQIYRLSDPVPATETRTGKNVAVSGDGHSFVYESDTDYGNTGLATYADGVSNIWRTSNVFGEDGTSERKFHLVSNEDKPSDHDAKWASVDYTGTKSCFHSNEPGEESIMYSEMDENGVAKVHMLMNLTKEGGRDAFYCDISSDGKTVVFNSDAELIPGLNVTKSNDQVYMVKNIDILRDDPDYGHPGLDFEIYMVSPSILATVAKQKSQGAVVSADGSYVAFRSVMQHPDYADNPSAARDEAWLYRTEDKKLERVTNFKPQECNTTFVYEKMQEMWGADNLTANNVNSAFSSVCNFAAAQGWIRSTGSVGIGAVNQPKMSDDGRFLSFTTNFNAATVTATQEMGDHPDVVTAINLYVYDSKLGFTWKITREGKPGPTLDAEIEKFCCPAASASKKRGACSLANEMKGGCCWQKPCWFPALNSHLSGDGHSVAFVGDMSHDLTTESYNKDLEIWHYHIPTSTFTAVTDTIDPDHDDLYPSVSFDGSVVGFTSDFDYTTGTPILSANQVFAAKLEMGCSRDVNAVNYMAMPDVETCCEFAETEAMGAPVTVDLVFLGDVSEMISRVAFANRATVANSFAFQYVSDIEQDLACSLSIPKAWVKVTSSLNELGSGATNTNGNIPITVEIHGGAAKTALALAEELVDQYADTKSYLWRAYLTKTMSASAVPVVTTLTPTLDPTSKPTVTPTEAPVSGSPVVSPTTASPVTKSPVESAPTAAPVDAVIEPKSDSAVNNAGFGLLGFLLAAVIL